MWQIPAMVISRLGPWLGRMGASVLPRALTALEKAGVSGLRSVDDIVKYAKENPLNASLVFSALAQVGFTVSDLFSPQDKTDINGRSAATKLAVIEMKAVDQKLLEVAEMSEELKGISGNRNDLKTLQTVLRWAKSHYGSERAAIDAWKNNQAFFELSVSDIETGFGVLDV